ncbi:TonB-dependent receptor plug domain-containing protein [Actinobacillus pleuropneumoniae]|nr:TonB-dependent receptor plug domain-containing protein [Actinobacillus pleuropneumoniae]MCY6410201.1 TonB-dependent receptor plug domain-containing protein [Actinobacillus pleuropneumoniae]
MKLTKISLSMAACLVNTQLYATVELDTVHVKGNTKSVLSGKYEFDQKNLTTKLQANSNVSDALVSLPSVRVSNNKNGNTLGEIAPQNISFHGERYYNNNFMLNGIGINDNVNPIGLGEDSLLKSDMTKTIDSQYMPAGHPQAFWLSTDLVDTLEVYDRNVPSQYGNFTGGVVNAKLKEPDFKRASGSVSYRTTRDAWTKFHLEGQYKNEFYRANSPLLQPKFTKHEYTIQLNQPLTERSGLLFAYSRQQSSVPQHQQYLHKWTNRYRRNETLLASYKNELNENNRLTINGIYSTHQADEYLENAVDGRFRLSGGGFLTNIKWENYNVLGLLTSELAYRNNRNQTKYDSDTLYRYTKTKSIDWISDPNTGEATKGGIGKRYTQQQSLQLKQNLDFNKFEIGSTIHEMSVGWEWQQNTSRLKQPKLAKQYAGAADYYKGEVFNIENCTYCIPKEQYFKYRVHYLPIDGKVKHNRFASYLQDKIVWNNFTFVPGVRFDYTQFTRKWNIAPRSYIDYNLLGKDQTHLIAGFNRYYAGDLVDYKLRSAFNFEDHYNRESYNSPWELDRSILHIAYKGSKLKTPYSDEINAGISQKISNSLWTFKWVQRNSKDQFMTQIDSDVKPQQRWLSNSGRSKHNTFSLEIESIEPIDLSFMALKWQFGVAFNKSKTNQTNDYTQRDWKDYGITKMLHKDKLQSIEYLPARNFNTPWKGYLQLESYFPSLNLNWAQRINYESSSKDYTFKGFRCTSEKSVCNNYEGLVACVYETAKPRHITLDWFFNWKKELGQHKAFSVNVSVLNVLNRKLLANKITTDDENYYQTYRAGRQFWLGAKYEW